MLATDGTVQEQSPARCRCRNEGMTRSTSVDIPESQVRLETGLYNSNGVGLVGYGMEYLEKLEMN